MFMSMLEGKLAIEKVVELEAELEKYIFATSLIGTTILYSSKGERSDAIFYHQ